VQANEMEEGKWEVCTDAYKQLYIYCHHSKSVAYFKRNENVFYFTAFEGDKKSLLYYFYLSCYKVYLSTDPVTVVTDTFPLQLTKNTITKWLQDIVSPFIIFGRLHYESINKVTSNDFLNSSISISSKQVLQFLSFKKTTNQSVIEITGNRISSFTFQKNDQQIKAICIPKSF
jgi:hypothetical protein